MKSLRLLAAVPLLVATLAAHAQLVPLDTNLIVNGDAEAATLGWNAFIDTPAFQAQTYAAPLFLYPDAPHGSQLFAGAASGLSAGWQWVDVSGHAAAIDNSRIGFQLAAYLGGVGNQEDNGLLYVSFLDAASNEIAHTELGPVYLDLRANLTVLGGFRTDGELPVGTRGIQFSLSMEAPDGNSSGAYADNMQFRLTSAVPEPQAWVLMALGLVALGATAGRRTRHHAR